MLLIGVQIHRKFCVMFSTYCTSNFRRNAFSVITAYDRLMQKIAKTDQSSDIATFFTLKINRFRQGLTYHSLLSSNFSPILKKLIKPNLLQTD